MARTKPSAPVRRFDVFAEYKRLEGRARGMRAGEAKGYGIWMAKVVAARRYGPPKTGAGKAGAGKAAGRERAVPAAGEWHVLSDVPQTDALFTKEIVARMGREFYREVFAPAIRAAYEAGEPYVAVRDTIRRDWKP